MSIKTIALAAATVAATSSVATAETYFEFGDALERSSVLELGLVRADADAVVEIYDEAAGERGALLGSQDIFEGANADVRVNLGTAPLGDVIAVIRVNDEIAEIKAFDVN